MVTTVEGRPHNRTSLTDAISQVRSCENRSGRPGSRPIFTDPLLETRHDVSQLADLMKEHFRTRAQSGQALSSRELKQNTIGFLDASERILKMLGYEAQANILARIHFDIDDDRPERAAATVAGM